MSKLLEMLKEEGVYSLTRVLTSLGYLAFIVLSTYLAFIGKSWDNYGQFATATGGAVLVQLGNKFINSKYNTPQGSAGKNI